MIPELRPIFGWPGYAIASDRSVWSNRSGEWRRLKGKKNCVGLCVNGRAHDRSRYQIWLETWGPDPPRPAIGSRHGRARLDEEKILEARRLRRAGWSERALADRYQVRPATMHYALVGHTWRHLPME
jgi:hypothetical protein